MLKWVMTSCFHVISSSFVTILLFLIQYYFIACAMDKSFSNKKKNHICTLCEAFMVADLIKGWYVYQNPGKGDLNPPP
jgi:hypothetical protein